METSGKRAAKASEKNTEIIYPEIASMSYMAAAAASCAKRIERHLENLSSKTNDLENVNLSPLEITVLKHEIKIERSAITMDNAILSHFCEEIRRAEAKLENF